MTKYKFWIGSVVLVLTCVSPARAEDSAAIGSIRMSSGSAFLSRGDQTIAARVGEPVLEADTIKTGSDGRLGVTLHDDTRLALGPDSELRLERFAFAPADGRLRLVLKIVRGVAAYVSGQIAKLSPDSVRLETPAAIVGVRGTTLVFRVEPE